MRRLIFAICTAIASLGIHASEQDIVDNGATNLTTLASISAEPVVTVHPIPMPAPVIELLKMPPSNGRGASVKKLKLAKKKPLPKSILSRTERQQLALLAPKHTAGNAALRDYFGDDDAEPGIDDLDLHRFFSRPKVASADNEDEGDVKGFVIPDTVKLRLFMARMKAVEAHALAKAADQYGELDKVFSENVRQRLNRARLQAVEAHQKTHGVAS